MDSLLSIVQMPKGIPVAASVIGEAGAANAGSPLRCLRYVTRNWHKNSPNTGKKGGGDR